MSSAQPCRSRPVQCAFQSPPEQPLQVKVVGLFKSNTFQIAKSTAEVTRKKPVRAALSAYRSRASWWRGVCLVGSELAGKRGGRVRESGHSTSRRATFKGGIRAKEAFRTLQE